MKASALLRAAAIVLLLHSLGHTLGGVVFYRPHSSAEASVIAAMQSSRVTAGGSTRSLWDFYYGSGLAVGVLSFMLAGIVWTLARLARMPGAHLGTFLVWIIAGCLLQVALCLRYFFVLPALLLLAAAGLCGAAGWVQLSTRRLSPPASDGRA
jgi:hypothetical protein